MKPQTLQCGSTLPSSHVKDIQARPCTEQARRPYLGNHRGHLTWPQLGDGSRVHSVFIAERKVIKQVLYGSNAFGRQYFGNSRTNTFDVLNRGVEFHHGEGCIDVSRTGRKLALIGGTRKAGQFQAAKNQPAVSNKTACLATSCNRWSRSWWEMACILPLCLICRCLPSTTLSALTGA